MTTEKFEWLDTKLAIAWDGLSSQSAPRVMSEIAEDVIKLIESPSSRTIAARQFSADASHQHDNGFMKLHLYDSADGRFRLRLHIWPPVGTSIKNANVHDHRFDFASLIVKGQLQQTKWYKNTLGLAFSEYIYLPRDACHRYHLHHLGETRLLSEPPETFQAGSAYLMFRDELHLAGAVEGISAMTLCLQNRVNIKAESRTYSTRSMGETSAFPAQALDLKTYDATVELFASAISPTCRLRAEYDQ